MIVEKKKGGNKKKSGEKRVALETCQRNRHVKFDLFPTHFKEMQVQISAEYNLFVVRSSLQFIQNRLSIVQRCQVLG